MLVIPHYSGLKTKMKKPREPRGLVPSVRDKDGKQETWRGGWCYHRMTKWEKDRRD